MKLESTVMKGCISMELTYTVRTDYLIPDMSLPEKEVHFGKYGMLRKTYLKNYKKGMYASLILSGKLYSHLMQIDLAAKEWIERIVMKLMVISPAPDKATDPMGWTGHMNSLRYSAEETVLMELIYI